MGYTIRIGQAVLGVVDNQYEVHVADAAGGPQFIGDAAWDTGHNVRTPSYSGWAEFTRVTGLRKLFYGAEGLIKSHPAIVQLRPVHLQIVRGALDQYKTEHPDAKPGWCCCSSCTCADDPEAPHVELDGDLARLFWLEFWMDVALKGADPAMENF